MNNPTILRLGHSPDPDDAFMWWPLADFKGPDGRHHKPQIDTGGYSFVHVLEDIQSLNVRTKKADLEITALSIHQYAFVADKYALTACGASMGDGYGPMIVCKAGRRFSPRFLKGKKVAIPGLHTTAWLTCQLWLQEFGMTAGDLLFETVMFDEIPAKVASGEYVAGLLIHEGQLTFASEGLGLVVDLGAWWKTKHNLPLPLGGNAIRRDLGETEMRKIAGVLLSSIRHALVHREKALAFAGMWGRGLDTKLADKFVGMYVNDWTLDFGKKGGEAVAKLLEEGAKAGLIPKVAKVDFVR